MEEMTDYTGTAHGRGAGGTIGSIAKISGHESEEPLGFWRSLVLGLGIVYFAMPIFCWFAAFWIDFVKKISVLFR